MTRHQCYTLSFPLYFLVTFLTTRVSFLCHWTRDAEKSDSCLHSSVKHYKINLHPDKHYPVPLLFPISPVFPLSIPLARGIAVLAEALCWKYGSVCQ